MGLWAKSVVIFHAIREHGKQSIRSLADRTGFSKSSVHRHLQAMDRRDRHPESSLWETEAGRVWLIRLVMDKNFKRTFATTAWTTQSEGTVAQWHGGAYLVFPPYPKVTFCLHTEHLSSILGGNSWHFHSLPAVRGGSYGASRCHLRTSGSEPDGALPRDCGAPGDLSRLTRGCPRGHRLARLRPAR